MLRHPKMCAVTLPMQHPSCKSPLVRFCLVHVQLDHTLEERQTPRVCLALRLYSTPNGAM